jgi:hypothetical protein
MRDTLGFITFLPKSAVKNMVCILETVLATFQNIWQFFSNHLVTLFRQALQS